MTGQTDFSGVIAAISRASFWVPEYICPSAWTEHAPFAFWICDALRPRCFVELGTHYGYSYFAFCQAIDRFELGTAAYAVDTWTGDEHAGFYDESVFQSVAERNAEKYAAFSSLIRSTFQDALDYFDDGSVDLLHIDGRHFYDDIKLDFTAWRPKLREGALVLLHDTNVRERKFGAWRFFGEIASQHPSFQFFHGHGLGVLALGEPVPSPLAPLFQAPREMADQIRAVYAALGGALSLRQTLDAQRDAAASLGHAAAEAAALRSEIEQRAATETAMRADIEQRAATEAALRADIEQRAATEAAMRADIEQRAVAAEALQTELKILRSKLAVAEQAAGAAEVLQGDIASLQTQRDVAKRDLRECNTKAEALQGEITMSRIRLAAAERHARERAAAAEVMQREITSLRGELAAARGVGRAALASLRIPSAPILKAPQNSSWLTIVLRRLGFPSSYPWPSARSLPTAKNHYS